MDFGNITFLNGSSSLKMYQKKIKKNE